MRAEPLRFRLQEERDYLSGGYCDGLAARLGQAHIVIQELLHGALDGFLRLNITGSSQRLPSNLRHFLKADQHQTRDEIDLLVGRLTHEQPAEAFSRHEPHIQVSVSELLEQELSQTQLSFVKIILCGLPVGRWDRLEHV